MQIEHISLQISDGFNQRWTGSVWTFLQEPTYQLMKELFPAEWLPISNTVIFFLGGSNFTPTDSATKISPGENNKNCLTYQLYIRHWALILKAKSVKLGLFHCWKLTCWEWKSWYWYLLLLQLKKYIYKIYLLRFYKFMCSLRENP